MPLNWLMETPHKGFKCLENAITEASVSKCSILIEIKKAQRINDKNKLNVFSVKINGLVKRRILTFYEAIKI
jgi:hypothetical protein